MRTIFLILLTAASYYIAGRLGLLLAIPPGYATAVWPAAGLALAAVLLAGNRVWIGILLGSFSVNVGTSFDSTSTATILHSLAVAGFIGSGAALQALVGGWLIRRFAGFANILTQEFGALRMLFLGGPLACVVNASISVTTLWWAGVIPDSNYLFNWWTWWVGDSIGVLIFTPLTLVWSLRPFSQWKRQQIMVTLPMALMFAAVVALFVVVSKREEASVSIEFEKWTERFNHEMGNDIDLYTNMLEAIVGLYDGSAIVDASEFKLFANRLLTQQTRSQALSWNAFVKQEDRDKFESTIRASIWPDYRIYEIGPDGRRIKAQSRPDYFPVVFTIPHERNEKAIGYDIGSEYVRRSAVERAVKSNVPTATGPIQLVQFDKDATGVLLLLPTFRDGVAGGELLGLASVVIRLVDLVQSAIDVVSNTGLQVFIVDDTNPDKPLPLYSSTGKDVPADSAKGLRRSTHMDVAGRDWRIDFYVPSEYLIANRSWQAWTLLAVGLFVTALLGMFVLVGVGHATRTEAVVVARTEELSQANEALRTSAELNRSIIETAFDAFIAIDEAGLVEDWNGHAETIFGWAKDEVKGKPLVDFIIPPQHKQSHVRGMQNYLRTGEASVINRRVETTALNRSGLEFPVELAIWKTRFGDGYRFNAFLHDISSRRHAEEAKALHARQLADKNAELERFAYVVSHDLQAPLRGITGFSELLGKRYKDTFDEKGKEFLGFIISGAAQMRRMIADILELSRIGSAKLEGEPVDTAALVDDVCGLLRMDIENAGASVVCEKLPVVSGDEGQLRQLFQNLIGNAIKFRPPDGKPEIQISVAQTAEGWHFQVADNGIGIPKDKQDKLFSLFVRLHSEEQYEGTGLGLAICKRIVERHGGRIWLESEPGQGTTFHFVLPA